MLIKSLSKSEKRYFKLFSKRESGESNYLRLFNAMDQQDDYDEEAINRQFKNERFVMQLHVTKNYLRKILMKSQRNFHAQLSKDAQLKDLLRNVELLYHKELYQHCKTELKSAEKTARKYELSTGMIEVLNWQRKLEQVAHPQNYQTFNEILSSQKKEIEATSNKYMYWKVAVEVSGALKGDTGDKYKNMLSNPSNAITLEAKVLHYNTKYFLLLQQDKPIEAENTLYELMGIFEKYPHRLTEDPELYISSINNLLSYLVFIKKYDQALQLIDKIKKLYDDFSITSENRTLLKQISRTYNIELEIFKDKKLQDQDITFLEKTEQFLKMNRNRLPKEYLISFWFQLAGIYFMRKDFSHSMHWLNQILNTKFKAIRLDLQVQARMLNLMVHLEHQNFFVLRYFVDSTRRFIRNIKYQEEYERVLLAFFSGISKVPLLEYKDRFRELHHQLFPANKDALIPPGILDYIDYKEWLEDKITGKK